MGALGRKRLLSEKEYPPACAYCLYGRPAPEKTTVLCPKRGVMLGTSRCGKYRYDPLKRVPKQLPKLPVFSAEEFQL